MLKENQIKNMGMIEAFTLDVLNDKNLFTSTMAEYDDTLKVAEDRGYSRVSGVDSYDINEWILIDMRTASAHIKFGEKDKAKKLIDWVVSQATLNFNLLPELFDYHRATYEGAIPRVGFGAGAYLKTINDFYKK